MTHRLREIRTRLPVLKVHFKLWLPNHLQVEDFLGWREHTVRADEEAGAEAAVLWLKV